jgi:hypothetical protein
VYSFVCSFLQITDAGLRSIGNSCHSLLSLNITGAKIVSDVGISSITSGCPHLKSLVCGGLYLLSDPRLTPAKRSEAAEAWRPLIGMAALAAQCPDIDHLDVTGCFRLNKVFEDDIAQYSHKLTYLNLTGCANASPSAFIALAGGCPSLRQINFSDCSGVTAAAMRAFSRNCREMKLVTLCRCRNLDGAAVKAIAEFTHLEKLDLSGCTSLVDSDLLPLCAVDKALSMTTLVLNNVKYISDSGLAWVATARTGMLRHFSYKGTSITRQSTFAVRDLFPFSDLTYNENFHGFWPKSRLLDRLLMNKYYAVCKGLGKIQARARKLVAKKRVAEMKELRRLNRAALKVTMTFRIARAKHILRDKRAAWIKRNRDAVTVQSIFHMAIAMARVRERKEMLFMMRRDMYATRIQTAFRNYTSNKIVRRLRAAFLEMLAKRRRAQIILQSGARMWAAMERVQHIRDYILATKRLRERKALAIQRVFRGHVCRKLARGIRAEREYIRMLRHESACKIQWKWRFRKTGHIVNVLSDFRRRKYYGATKVQAIMRGKIARWKYREMKMVLEDARREKAAIRMQTRLRMLHARILVNRLLVARRELIARQTKASVTFSKHWRGRDARLILKELRRQRDEDIRQRVLLEMWAVVKIQACYRGMRGRMRFDEKLKEKKGKWKELMDEAKGRRFFYNKLTGEIRWRMPKDLLDLIPRPKCDNCSKFEAGVECAVCDEVFCHSCWTTVHAGGRRKDHEFRVLYDYYGKRIDYGDGSFPCKWSTEVIQDEVQGWMLRVAPIRDPIAVFGDWEYYGDDSTVIYNPSLNIDASKAFYFNRKTFETSYDTPKEVIEYHQYYTAQPETGTGFLTGYAEVPAASDSWTGVSNLDGTGEFNQYHSPQPPQWQYSGFEDHNSSPYDYTWGGTGDHSRVVEEEPQQPEKSKTAGFTIRKKKSSGKKLQTMKI